MTSPLLYSGVLQRTSRFIPHIQARCSSDVKSSSLSIYVGKTKELALIGVDPLSSLRLRDQTVEMVNCFSYLGTIYR